MKKICISLSIVFLILFAQGQTLIRDHLGVTSFLDWVPLDSISNIKVNRTFTSGAYFTPAPEEYMFEPTWQQFNFDSYLAEGKSKGIKFLMSSIVI